MRAPISIVIPTAGNTPFVDRLLKDLGSQTVLAKDVHVVVNNKQSHVTPQPWHTGTAGGRVSFLSREHYYARGINFALLQVQTESVAVINDDVRLSSTWIEAMMEALDRYPDYGSFASRVVSLRNESSLDSCGDSLYLSGRATANGWLESVDRWTAPCEVFSASGCLSTYRVADLRQAGFLDEDFTAYMEDVDLGFRLQLLGRPCLFWSKAEAGHIGGATRKTSLFAARLAERNSVLTLVKNLPRSLFAASAPDFLEGHMRPCVFEDLRSWPAWRSGKLSAISGIPAALKKRARIQGSRRVSDAYIRSILAPGHPSKCHL